MSQPFRPPLALAAWCSGAALLSFVELASAQPAQPTPGPAPAPTAPAPVAPAQPGPTDPAQPPAAAPGQPAPGQPAPAPPGQPAPGQPAPGQPAPGQPAPAAPPEAPPPAPPPPVAPPPPEAPAPEPPPAVEPPPEPAPVPVLVDEGPEIVDGEDEALDVFMFVDANYAITTSHRDTGSPPHRAYAANGADGTVANGFAMEWAGLDLNYTGGEIGATASLRFGDGVPTYFGDRSPSGIANLTQGYLTWMPHERVALDLGQFGTIFGAEVSESWRNLNYTRGALYYLMQPFFHTGLKASVAFSDAFGVNAMVVNGVNSTFDEDDAPSLGLQFAITPNEFFELYVGGLQTLDSDADSSGFDTFTDLVALVHVEDLTLVLNADYDIHRDGVSQSATESADGSFFGVSFGAGYSFNHLLGVAARYEFLRDPDDMLYGVNPDAGTKLHTATATLDLKPLPGRDNLVVRWDNRYEFASEDIFATTTDERTNGWFASVLGVVVKMDE